MSNTTMDNDPDRDIPGTINPGEFRPILHCSNSSLALVRADFNPAHSTEVGRIKQLHAALITMAEELRSRPLLPERTMGDAEDVPSKRKNDSLKLAQRNCSIAITHLEDAAMHMVKAATA